MTTEKTKPRNQLTPRQLQVLTFITAHLENFGYPPTLREISAHLGVSGSLPATKHLNALEKKGYIKRDSVSRGIGLISPASHSVSLPIVGTVRAGQLSTALEDIQGYFSVDRQAVKGSDCFLLKVRGDSMINAGILDGDLALIKPQATARNRDTVVVMVNGDATLKWFYSEGNQIRLQPANPNMEPIIIRPGDGDVTIVGKVVGVYRQLE
jgi:repressor LexA